MKALKIIGIIILVLLVIILIPPLFVDGNYAVEKEVTVNQPKTEVFNYLRYLKNQEDFSVWAKMDPNAKKTYTGEDGSVGAVYAWEGDKKTVGTGEQEIINISEGERIDFELRFKVPFEATDYAYIETDAVNDSTTLVKWGFNGKMAYPMKGMLIFMDMEEMLGGDLQEGLDNLKELKESV